MGDPTSQGLPARPWGRYVFWASSVGVFLAIALGAFLFLRHRAELERQAERQEGLRLAGQGKFEAARPLLERARERSPGDAQVLKALVLGCAARGDRSGMGVYLTDWCEASASDPEPFLRRMQWRQQSLFADLAIEDGLHALDLNPKDAVLRRRVARLLLENRRAAEAERECLRALKDEPDDPEALYLLASAYHALGQSAKAEPILDSLLSKDPDAGGPLLLRAILYYQADQPARAIPLLRQVLDKDPNPKARYYLALALHRAGHIEEAKRTLAEGQPR
jgi:tetratricopeptide (TPR) repeat protein